jgi:hypothetical protein
MMASRGEVAQAEQVKEAEEQVKEAKEETQTAPHDSSGKSPPVIKKGALFGWRGAAANVKGTHVLQVQVEHLLQPNKQNIILVEDKHAI